MSESVGNGKGTRHLRDASCCQGGPVQIAKLSGPSCLCPEAAGGMAISFSSPTDLGCGWEGGREGGWVSRAETKDVGLQDW